MREEPVRRFVSRMYAVLSYIPEESGIGERQFTKE